MTQTTSSIDTFNHFFHQPSLHPMVAVGDLSRADDALYEEQDFGMYCVILMDASFGDLFKNGQQIHYQSGSIFSLKPGQRAALRRDYTVKPRGWMLAFRPELLVKSGLGRDFYMFDFFNHEVSSALELTERERGIMVNCFENTFSELLQEPDYLTNHMIRLSIGQLLSYCKRFFERQYIERVASGRNLGRRLDTMIDHYLSSGSRAAGPAYRQLVRGAIQSVTQLLQFPGQTRTTHFGTGIHSGQNHSGRPETPVQHIHASRCHCGRTGFRLRQPLHAAVYRQDRPLAAAIPQQPGQRQRFRCQEANQTTAMSTAAKPIPYDR